MKTTTVATITLLALSLTFGGATAGLISVMEDGVHKRCGSEPVGNAQSIYVIMDDTLPGAVSIWIYEESNGIDGLQRADEVCDESNGEEADTIIF